MNATPIPENPTGLPKQPRFIPRWLILLWLGCFLALFKPWIHGSDPVGYYAWLRSAVCDGDLDTTNEMGHYKQDERVRISPGPTGRNRNPYGVGAALLWSPFFLTAHVASHAFGWPTDGFAQQYVMAIGVGSAVYTLLGLALCLRIARRFAGTRAAAWSTVLTLLATPLVFYAFSHPSMSHAVDAFGSALVLAIWLETRGRRTLRGWLALGAALGLAALVRPQNIVLTLLPASELVFDRPRGPALRTFARDALLGAGAALLVFAPQLVVWKLTYGSFVPGNPYRADLYHGRFDLTSPHFGDVLFSPRTGIFFWVPAWCAGIAGIAVLTRRQRAIGAATLAVLLAQIYIIGSWNMWAAGGFGQRLLLGCTPIYALGLSVLVEAMGRRLGWRITGALVAGAILWNLLLLVQYIVGLTRTAHDRDIFEAARNQVHGVRLLAGRLGGLLRTRLGLWR